jgi:hypothetical protein
MQIARLLLRPFGHLAFFVSALALSCCRLLLSDRDELGFFAGRLSRSIWRYPEVTRRGMQVAWVLWVALLVTALSPIDPIASRWDEVALAPLPLFVLLRRHPV